MVKRIIHNAEDDASNTPNISHAGINRRAVIVATALAWIALHLITLTLRAFTLGVEHIHPFTPFSIIIMLAVVWASIKQFNATLLASIMLVNMAITLETFIYISSGFKGPVIYLTSVLPLVAFLLIGRRTGWLVCVLVIANFSLFSYLNYIDYTFPSSPIKGNGIYVLRAFSISFVVILISWIAWYFAHVHDRFFQTLQNKNIELGRISQHKSDFLANMSHEFRTPLNAIIGFSNLLIKRNKKTNTLDQRSLASLESIQRNGGHLLELVTDILDVMSLEEKKIELINSTIDIAPLLQRCLEDTKILADDKALALHLNIPQALDKTTIFADAKRLRQIILNLLSNAIKYTDEGCVTLSVKNHTLRITNCNIPSIAITVSDTGCGISEEQMPKLFQKFSRQDSHLRSSTLGTGLGLVITRALVSMHGGCIEVESEPNQGSQFTVIIPINSSR